MKQHRPTPIAIIITALALLGTACVNTTDAGDLPPQAAEPTTSTRLTIPEEATTLPEAEPGGASTTATEPAPPDDPSWLGQNLQLLTLATLDNPTALASRSGGDDLWITERAGRIRQIQRRTSIDEDEQSLRLMNTIVLDITDQVTTAGEGGLLGLTFSSNGQYLYVNYTNKAGNTVISEFEMSAITAIPETERVLLEIEQPFSNHNGGQISFGPDGFLYVGMGDGGSGGDPLNAGQDTSTLLGAMLRIDPAADAEDAAYGIPGDNPFADGQGGRPEIWSWGLRNPWRFSWDADTDDLWIADVGQNELEEITVLRRGSAQAGRGANLGWRIMEGDRLFDGDEPPADHSPPIFTYDHSNGRCSITGGYVYRGDLNRALEGVYVFGDYCSREVFGLEVLDDGQLVVANLIFDRELTPIISFGEGSEGELYILEGDGRVSLIRRPGVGPRVRVFDSDDRLLGGEVDDSVTPNPNPNADS
jgi:glucose/arabinose dehydrogenase